MRFLLLILFIPAFGFLYAQRAGTFHQEEIKTMEDAFGRPLRPQTTYAVEGSPFFPKEYSPAKLRFASGGVNTKLKAKLNLSDNTILFEGENAEDMLLLTPAVQVEFYSGGDGAGYSFFKRGFKIRGLDESLFYQVIDSGKVTLLKHIVADYRDVTQYGTAVITRKFEQKVTWYLIVDSIAHKAEKNNANVPAILADKKEEVEAHIRRHNLKIKNEADLLSVVRFYNSLFP